MKRLAVVLLLGLVTLSGCASFPSPADTSGGLLAFPMQVSSDSGGQFYYTYEFRVFRTGEEGVVDRIVIDPTLNKRVDTFGPYPAGDYYLGVQTTWPKHTQTMKYSYNPTPRRVFYAFTIEEDTITVLNNQINVHKNRDRTTSSHVVSLSRPGQAEAVEQLRSEDEAGLWRIKARFPLEE